MTITEFLLARIAEDEAVALAANGPSWGHGDGNVSEGGLYACAPGEEDGWSIAWFELGTANADANGDRVLPRWSTMKRHAHENSVHAARHDPARVLAECKAKRAIIDVHQCSEGGMEVWLDAPDAAWSVEEWADFTPGYYSRDACLCCSDLTLMAIREREWPCRTMRALASVYADHPHYRQEWAL